MSYTYTTRKKADPSARKAEASHDPSLDALRSGAVKPTQEQMGHRVDLPDAMREKMENAFGADLSAVKVYESQAVEDAGANAVAQGSNIAFAPGMLDFTSYSGQALLGHEISHVVSQARGEVTGSGFLNDRALEARADREGATAAAGQQVAVPTASMSPVSAASASGPMQAGKKERRAANEKLDKLYRARAYSMLKGDKNIRSADSESDAESDAPDKLKDLQYGTLKGDLTPFNVIPPNQEETQELIHSLSDMELDMLHKRIINSSLETHKLNRKLQSNRNMSRGERLFRAGMSASHTDTQVYKSLLSDFKAGPRFSWLADEDGKTPDERAEESRKRVLENLSGREKRNLKAVKREFKSGQHEIDDYSSTKPGLALGEDLVRSKIYYLKSKLYRHR